MFRYSVLSILIICINQSVDSQDYFFKIDSSDNDIEYYEYYTKYDTATPALEYALYVDKDTSYIMSDMPVDTEPTFKDRFFSDIQIDTTGTVYITKAITAREIARQYLIDKYGLEKINNAGKLLVAYVDQKYWMILCEVNRGAMDGSVLIILSKFDGRIISWSNI